MPTTNQLKTAWIDTSPVQRPAQYDALSKRGAYVIVSGEDATDLTPPPLTTHLIYNGLIFWYDAADTTSLHDGVSTIVTFDAKRFKSDAYNGRGLRRYSVIDKDLATPPGSPTVGDAYIVAAGGTGAWATKDKKIAVATSRGWVFIQPNVYDEVLVVDEVLVYHYSAGALWTAGTPGVVLPAGGVSISMLKYGLGLRIFNQTTTAPPGSPSEGHAYIIATGGTGAWAGHDGKVAIWESGAWTILAPVDGWTVYDVSLNRAVYYEGGAWIDPLVLTQDWIPVEDRVISSPVAQADFVGMTAYKHYRFDFIGVKPSADSQLWLRTSTDNGLAFDAGANTYQHNTIGLGTKAILADTTIESDDAGVNGKAELWQFHEALKCMVMSDVGYLASNGASTRAAFTNHRMNATARNAVRVLQSTGNIASGRIILRGRN